MTINYLDDGLIALEDALKVADFFGVPFTGTAAEILGFAASVEPEIVPIVGQVRQLVTDLSAKSKSGQPVTEEDKAQVATAVAQLEKLRASGEVR